MLNNRQYENIDELLAEADKLVQQVRSDAMGELEKTHLQEIEKYALEMKKIKAEVLDKHGKKENSGKDSGAEGMHEAILDIVKAMRGYKNKLV